MTEVSIDTGARRHPPTDARAVKILAKSVYKELKASGHSRSDIVGFTNAVLELVTTDLRDSHAPASLK